MPWYRSFHKNIEIIFIHSPGLLSILCNGICTNFGEGNVIKNLAQELNTQKIWSDKESPNQIVLVHAQVTLGPFHYDNILP